MRGKSMILIVIALGCGLVASIGISKILDRQGDAAPEVATKKIYVAVENVDIGKVINPEMIKLEEWPADRVPEGAISELEEVEGLAPSQRLYAGEVIRREKLVSKEMAAGRAIGIPKGYRVKAIKVSSDSAVGNIITPGDHVDVQVYLRKSATIPQPTTKTILEDVRVFAVNSETEKQVDEEGQKINAKTVSLLVKPEQVQTLLLASRLGQIDLSLRHPDDDSQTIADNGAGVEDLIKATAQDGTPDETPQLALPTPEADPTANARGSFADFLKDLSPQPQAEPAQPEQLAKTEHFMQVLSPEGIKTYSLIDDEEFSEAKEVGTTQPVTTPLPAAAPQFPGNVDADWAPETEPTTDLTDAPINDPDYVPADTDGFADGDAGDADSDDISAASDNDA